MPWIELLGLKAQLLHLSSKEPTLSLCTGLWLGAWHFTLALLSPAEPLQSVALSSTCSGRLKYSPHSLLLQLLLVDSFPSAKLSLFNTFFLNISDPDLLYSTFSSL